MINWKWEQTSSFISTQGTWKFSKWIVTQICISCYTIEYNMIYRSSWWEVPYPEVDRILARNTWNVRCVITTKSPFWKKVSTIFTAPLSLKWHLVCKHNRSVSRINGIVTNLLHFKTPITHHYPPCIRIWFHIMVCLFKMLGINT